MTVKDFDAVDRGAAFDHEVHWDQRVPDKGLPGLAASAALLMGDEKRALVGYLAELHRVKEAMDRGYIAAPVLSHVQTTYGVSKANVVEVINVGAGVGSGAIAMARQGLRLHMGCIEKNRQAQITLEYGFDQSDVFLLEHPTRSGCQAEPTSDVVRGVPEGRGGGATRTRA